MARGRRRCHYVTLAAADAGAPKNLWCPSRAPRTLLLAQIRSLSLLRSLVVFLTTHPWMLSDTPCTVRAHGVTRMRVTLLNSTLLEWANKLSADPRSTASVLGVHSNVSHRPSTAHSFHAILTAIMRRDLTDSSFGRRTFTFPFNVPGMSRCSCGFGGILSSRCLPTALSSVGETMIR